MAPVPQGSLVLITSGNGYIGSWTCLYALRAGYQVRTTVRTASKGDYLKQLFAEFGDKFSYVLVNDLRTKGGFDEAVKGAAGVIHTGSPVDGDPNLHPDDSFIKPAVEGTTNVLEAIRAAGEAKRVVLTSSTSAVGHPNADANAHFTAEDWNTPALKLYEADPTGSGKKYAYDASKVLAERAAWDFVEKTLVEGKVSGFDLTTICPTFVFGPTIAEVQGSPEKLNFSLRIQWDLFSGKVPVDTYQEPKGGYVDVRDVALAHVAALSKPEAGGQRLPAVANTWTYQDAVDAIHASKVATDELKQHVLEGRPGSGIGVIQSRTDGSKLESILGVHYRNLQQVIDGEIVAFNDLAKRGWTGQPGKEVLAL